MRFNVYGKFVILLLIREYIFLKCVVVCRIRLERVIVGNFVVNLGYFFVNGFEWFFLFFLDFVFFIFLMMYYEFIFRGEFFDVRFII